MENNIGLIKLNESTLDNLSEGLLLIGYDWRYLYINRVAVEQIRYKSKIDLLGYTMMEKCVGIRQNQMFSTLQKCMNERIPQKIVVEINFPDNSKAWFEFRIHPALNGIVIYSSDVSERERYEKRSSTDCLAIQEMTFMISHKLRQLVSNIIGLSGILKEHLVSPNDLRKVVDYMEKSAINLDSFTKELSKFVEELNLSNREESIKRDFVSTEVY